VDLGTDEAFYEMNTMLFDYADADAIIEFIADVREFSLEYQVYFLFWLLFLFVSFAQCLANA
jgi:hypothetical protein